LSLFSEYSFFNKLFGNGFSYLKKFGKKFYDSEDVYDYPHNLLISTLLYSGVIGFLIYIGFLFTILRLYIKYRKALLYLFILFLFTGIFVSISGNSHFSIPSFNFISLIPLFYYGFEKKLHN
jgi:O-antigen ligase